MVQTTETAKAVPDCETVGEIGQPLGASRNAEQRRRDLGGVLEGSVPNQGAGVSPWDRETLLEFFQNTFDAKSTGLGVRLGLKERGV